MFQNALGHVLLRNVRVSGDDRRFSADSQAIGPMLGPTAPTADALIAGSLGGHEGRCAFSDHLRGERGYVHEKFLLLNRELLQC